MNEIPPPPPPPQRPEFPCYRDTHASGSLEITWRYLSVRLWGRVLIGLVCITLVGILVSILLSFIADAVRWIVKGESP